MNPNVSAEVITRRPFFVIGEVQKPGNYPYVTSMTAINAVAMAGGYTCRARKNNFYIRRARRQRPDGSHRSHSPDTVSSRATHSKSGNGFSDGLCVGPIRPPGRRRVALRAVPPTPHYLAAEPVAPPGGGAGGAGLSRNDAQALAASRLIAACTLGAGRGGDRRGLVDALLLCRRRRECWSASSSRACPTSNRSSPMSAPTRNACRTRASSCSRATSPGR